MELKLADWSAPLIWTEGKTLKINWIHMIRLELASNNDIICVIYFSKLQTK